VADVRARLEHHRDAGEHVDGAILLNVAAVLDDNAAPVTPDRGAGTNVHVTPDDHVSRDGCIRVYESTFVNDRFVTVEFVYH